MTKSKKTKKEYKVQAILDRRINHQDPFSKCLMGKIQYKVKWVGYPQQQATWEPLLNIRHLSELISQFEVKYKADQPKNSSQTLKKAIQRQGNLRKKEDQDSDSERLQKSQHRVIKQVNKPKKSRAIKKQLKTQTKRKVTTKISEDDRGRQKIDYQMQKGSYKKVIQLQKQQSAQNVQTPEINQNLEDIEEVLSLEVQPKPQQLKEKTFVIIQLCKRNNEFIFIVQDSGTKRFASRSEIVRNHSLALIQFYQRRGNFIPKTKRQQEKEFINVANE